MRQRMIMFLVSCVIAYGCLLRAPAGDAAEKSLTIAAFDYKPFVNEDSEGHGYIAEIATAALQRAGYDAEYYFAPLKRALALAEQGKVDGVLGAYYAEERTSYLEYSEPMGDIRVNFFRRADKNIAYTQLSDLTPYTIGVLSGTSLVAALQKDGLQAEEANGNLNNLKKLLVGRIDLFVGTTEWILYDLRANFSQAEQDQIMVLDPPYQIQQVYFTTAKKKENSAQIIKDFNDGLKQIKADGTYQAILEKHGIAQ